MTLYVFLAIWSIGFGYGFWWSSIAGEEATRSGLSGLQEDARDASSAIVARLDAVRSQLDNVVSWSESQMARRNPAAGVAARARERDAGRCIMHAAVCGTRSPRFETAWFAVG